MQEAAIRASWRSFLARRHLLRRRMGLCWRDAAAWCPAGDAKQPGWPQVKMRFRSTLADGADGETARRASGGRSFCVESLMLLCNTTLCVFPSWPHFFFVRWELCFTSQPRLYVRVANHSLPGSSDLVKNAAQTDALRRNCFRTQSDV